MNFIIHYLRYSNEPFLEKASEKNDEKKKTRSILEKELGRNF